MIEEVDTYAAIEKQVIAQEYDLKLVREKLHQTQKENRRLRTEVQNLDYEVEQLLADNENLDFFLRSVVFTPKNYGSDIDFVKHRSKLKKLKVLRNAAEKALAFVERFGVKVNKIELKSLSKGQTFNLEYAVKQGAGYKNLSLKDQERVQGILYVMDKFGISDDAYHALSMAIGQEAERSYIVKQCKTQLNSISQISATPGSSVGAQHDFCLELDRLIEDTQCADNELIKLRLAGDGTKVSKTLNFLNFCFGLLNQMGPVPAASGEEGNRTLAVIQTTESYEKIAESLADQVAAINSLQATRNSDNIVHYTTASGKQVRLQLYVVGDMKWLLLIAGLSAAHATFSCLYCKIPKLDRWITSRRFDYYTSVRLVRTIEQIVKLAMSKKGEKYGVQHKPLFDIPLLFWIIDELHMCLRVTDVLKANMVAEADQIDRLLKGSAKHAIRDLEAFIDSIVSFKIWKDKKDKWDWTALNGVEKKKLIRELPAKLRAHPHSFCHEETRLQIADLWENFGVIYFKYISSNADVTKSVCMDLFDLASKWVNDFVSVGNTREGYSKACVTPYMHVMMYHAPVLMLAHNGIKSFTTQGVEKVNDELKRIYFQRCNKALAAKQTLQARWRRSLTRKHRPVKRLYRKKNVWYWANLKRK